MTLVEDKIAKTMPEKGQRPSRSGKRTMDDDDDENFVTPEELARLSQRGYRLKGKLSQGCSSKIYLTKYSRPDRPDVTMACKVIDKKNGEPKFISKFLPREVSILSELSNPHCVQIYSILEIRSKCFVFMRYAENGDLLDYLTQRGAVDESHARMWMRQLLLALAYLQSKDIAHRDIKCENVLITENLNAKLADFGFARYMTDEKGKEVLSETYCGSLSYAAPEILRGQPYPPTKCDVWSLGVVFFVMLNLAKPFSKKKASLLLQQQLEKNYKFRAKTISEGAKDLIRAMLEPELSLRPSPRTLLGLPWMVEDELLLKLVPDPQPRTGPNHSNSSHDHHAQIRKRTTLSTNRSSFSNNGNSSLLNERLWRSGGSI